MMLHKDTLKRDLLLGIQNGHYTNLLSVTEIRTSLV